MLRNRLRTIAVMLVLVIAVCVPAQALADRGQPSTLAPSQAAFEQTVQALTPYVVRASDGTFSLNVSTPKRILLGVNENAYGGILAGMAVVNKEISLGHLRTDANRNVFQTRLRGHVGPLANQQGIVETYWWGFKLALTHDQAAAVVAAAGVGGTGVGGVALWLNLAPGVGNLASAIVGTIAAALIIDSVLVAYWDRNATGVYVYFTWAGGVLWGGAQPK